MVQATSSVSYTLDGNTFTLFLEAQAQGTWQGGGLPATMAFGRGTASADTGGLWLYTEQPAIVSFSANPITFASPTSLTVSSAELRYYFGDLYTTCLNYLCAGPLSGTAPIAPGELLWTGASADILAYGHHAYGFSGAGSSLRLVAQAWAADGSPVPLLLAAPPNAFSIVDEPLTSTPEPATLIVTATGLALAAARRRRSRTAIAQRPM